MRTLVFTLGAVAVFAGACIVAPAVPLAPSVHIEAAGPPAAYGPFYEPLQSWGRWFIYGEYGWVWSPTVVSAEWRPYTVGQWVWTDQGWLFVADEPWGWATYHYGRWVYDGEYGWIWVPDTEWGPGWVCWREGPEIIGWAPMPPGFVIVPGHSHCDPWIGGWVFIETDTFVFVHVDHYILPASRNPWIAEQTQPLTVSAHHERVTTYAGPDPARVESHGAPVPRLGVEFGARPGAVTQDRVTVYRPEFPATLSPSRVRPSPGAVRLDETPRGGQHRPEVERVPGPLAPLPEGTRGPKVPDNPPTSSERRAPGKKAPDKKAPDKKAPEKPRAPVSRPDAG